jgi:DNA modification methylase
VSIVHQDDMLTVHHGDARDVLRSLPAESVHCVVTSPPYWGLRDYKAAGQVGLEPTLDAYLGALVDIFAEVRRVLRHDGTVWLNLGDAYSGAKSNAADGLVALGRRYSGGGHKAAATAKPNRAPALKPKDRLLLPARVAIALQSDGWWVRDEIVWSKPNPMPSSVEDRTTPAHEMVYLLTRSARYSFDAAAIREAATTTRPELLAFGEERPDRDGTGHIPDRRRQKVPGGWDITKGEGGHGSVHRNGRTAATYRGEGSWHDHAADLERGSSQGNGGDRRRVWEASGRLSRNKRSVWTVATEPYPDAHYATFPTKLIEPMILAGCPRDGVVLDPFGGSGTVGQVARSLGRRAVLIEINPDYVRQAIVRATHATVDPGGQEVPEDSLWAGEAAS